MKPFKLSLLIPFITTLLFSQTILAEEHAMTVNNWLRIL
ncbi:MAG: hypothetical protein BMS9Abin15_0292 [Gammaproteobacteria bacterium]|nr:MAG: hypothetical protein BMS9Abin15_0292 [Gammaproteobacteria bacterium]